MIRVTFYELAGAKREHLAETELEILPQLHHRVRLNTEASDVIGTVADVNHDISPAGVTYSVGLVVYRLPELTEEVVES